LFLVKNPVFELLDQIAPELCLGHKITEQKSRIVTPLEFFGAIFMILFDRFLSFLLCFFVVLKAKFKTAEMGEILIADYT